MVNIESFIKGGCVLIYGEYMVRYIPVSKKERRKKRRELDYRSLYRRVTEFLGRYTPRMPKLRSPWRRKEIEYRSVSGKPDPDFRNDAIIMKKIPPEQPDDRAYPPLAYTREQPGALSDNVRMMQEEDRTQYAREMPVPPEAMEEPVQMPRTRMPSTQTRRNFLYYTNSALLTAIVGLSGVVLGIRLNEGKHKRRTRNAAVDTLDGVVEDNEAIQNGIHENGVRPIQQVGRDISTKEDIQSLLGLAVDGDVGPQTKYALETLLLDIEKQVGAKFKKVNYADISDEIYALLNRVNDRDIDVRVTNVEAVAHRFFGAYIMDKGYLDGHKDTIHTEEQAFEFFGVKNKRKKKLREELLAFKTIMNYKHGISMPINTKLDDTAYIAINYAKAVALDRKVKDFSHSRLEVTANGRNYDFLIPSFGMSIIPYSSVVRKEDAIDPHDPVIRMVANEVTKNLSTKEGEAKHLLRFVQEPGYSYDVGGGSFHRHPLKTLTERTGDCEDSTDLYLSLLRARGIECGYVFIDDLRPDTLNHAMALVEGKFHGEYFKKFGGKYFLTETTNPGWNIGDNPYKDVPTDLIKWYPEKV